MTERRHDRRQARAAPWLLAVLLAGGPTAAAADPPGTGGLSVDGTPLDLDKLRAAVKAATAGVPPAGVPDRLPPPSDPEASAPPAAAPTPADPPVAVPLQMPPPGSQPLPPPTELPPTPPPPAPPAPPDVSKPLLGTGGQLLVDGKPVDPSLMPRGWNGSCPSCGGVGGGCSAGICTGSQNCRPGRHPCEPFEANTAVERFLSAIYTCVCCPDPCYEPYWDPLMNAAFFVDPVRPATQTRLRWDRGYNVRLPDRNEYFWPRADGLGAGPPPYILKGVRVSPRVDYHELTLYTEAARGPFSLWTELPYRNSDPWLAFGGSGFGDLKIGTKSLLADSELCQIAFQFVTILPTGVGLRGLGTEHVSLELGTILGLRLTPTTALQAQVTQFVPIGGDPGYAGGILHYHFSLNQKVWQPVAAVQVMGTCELNGWTFQDGAYTDPVLGPNQRSTGQTYLSAGPGVRFSVCNNLDFGVGSAFALTYPHWAASLFRFELRYRY